MYESYKKYVGDSDCDACEKTVEITYGMGSNNVNGGDVIAYCVECLKRNNPNIYVKHVRKGNINDSDLQKVIDLVEQAKKCLTAQSLPLTIKICTEDYYD